MDDQVKRAIFTNLLLLSQADGRVDDAEARYLQKVSDALGIAREQAATWRVGVQFGETDFQSIENPEVAEAALVILARMVRVDGEFKPSEQEAYLALGKALGWSAEDLGPVLRKVWNADPDDVLREVAWQVQSSGLSILVVRDDFKNEEGLKKAAPGASVTFASMDAVSRLETDPPVVLFHAAAAREESARRLSVLKGRFKNSFVAFVARRDQAPQIGYLLGLGAKRCFVEPLYPNEIDTALKR